ncbi:MAG: secondary thiamine-phosphate synthase enzyme YjbQ [Candidatus Zixiibacteriota bacterium]
MVRSETISFRTTGDGDIIDLTERVSQAISHSGLRDGIVSVCAIGSTAAVTTIENEPGLRQDLPALLERLVPSQRAYAHDATWGDGNGYAHLRSALVGTSFTTAVADGRPVLGTWQQIVFLEFDNRPRSRSVRVQIIGE